MFRTYVSLVAVEVRDTIPSPWRREQYWAGRNRNARNARIPPFCVRTHSRCKYLLTIDGSFVSSMQHVASTTTANLAPCDVILGGGSPHIPFSATREGVFAGSRRSSQARAVLCAACGTLCCLWCSGRGCGLIHLHYAHHRTAVPFRATL